MTAGTVSRIRQECGLMFVLAGLLCSATGCTRSDKARVSNSAPKASAELSASEPAATVKQARERALAVSATARSDRCIVPPAAEPPAPVEPADTCPSDPGGAPSLGLGRVSFSEAPGKPSVSVEIAQTDRARARGLMYRTQLDEARGMLFSWNEARPRSFWMKNTCIPLDMLFIDEDGVIVGIVENVPTLNQAPRGVPCPAAHVLEVNAGWTRRHGVFAGQRIEIER